MGGQVERPEVVGARQAIIHQRAGAELAAFGVISGAFVESLAYSLDEATMHLALHNERIDDAPEIVGCGKIQQRNRPGVTIDFHLGNMRSRRIGEVRRIIKRCLVKAGLDRLYRIVVRYVGGQGDLGERYAPVSTRYRELAVLELNIGLRCFEEVSSNLLALAHHLVDRLDERRAAYRE